MEKTVRFEVFGIPKLVNCGRKHFPKKLPQKRWKVGDITNFYGYQKYECFNNVFNYEIRLKVIKMRYR